MEEELKNEGRKARKEECMLEGRINTLKALVNTVLNLKERGFPPEEISEITNMQPDAVELFINSADLSQSYLDYCGENDEEPSYEVFSKEAAARFKGISQETIDAIEDARNNIANS